MSLIAPKAARSRRIFCVPEMEGTKKQATDDGAGTMSQKNPFILGEEAMDEDGKEPVS